MTKNGKNPNLQWLCCGRPHRVFRWVLVSVALLLSACSEDTASRSASADDGDAPYTRVNGRLMGDLTLRGSLWGIDALPWTRLCVQDLPEGEAVPLCSTSDSAADYRVTGLFNTSGLLTTAFTDRLGRERTLASLYTLDATGDTAARANINPVTDVLARVYTEQTTGTTADECLATERCAGLLDGGLDHTALSRLQTNLSRWLEPIWPEDAVFPWQEEYPAEAMDNPWIDWHRRIDFRHTEDPDTGQLLVQARPVPSDGCPDTDPLATVHYEQLGNAQLPDSVDFLTADELENLDDCALTTARDPPGGLDIVAEPDRGPAPLATRIRINPGEDTDHLGLTVTLTNSRGQILDVWSQADVTRTLSTAGTHHVAVEAVDGSDVRVTGTRIDVGTSDETALPPTWGDTGSCRPPDSERAIQNLGANQCFEFQDGTQSRPAEDTLTCRALNEREDLLYGTGVCSQTSQYGEDLLGVCTRIITQVRIFYYRTPYSGPPPESRRQEHDRQRARCRLDYGTWESRL